MDKNIVRMVFPHFTLLVNTRLRTIVFEPHDTAQSGHKIECLSYVGGFPFIGFDLSLSKFSSLMLPPDDYAELVIDVKFLGENPNLRDYLGYTLRLHRESFDLHVIGRDRYQMRFDTIDESIDLCPNIPKRVLVILGKAIMTEHKIVSESNVLDITGGKWLGNSQSSLISGGTQEVTVHFMPNRKLFNTGTLMILEGVVSNHESRWNYVAG